VKGFAYVQLKERRLVSHVCDILNRSKLEGRTITVERSQSTLKVSSVGYTAHVNNLSFKIQSEGELKELFEKEFGEVKRAHLICDEHGRSKGFGFVEFIDGASLEKAVKRKELIVKDRIAIIKKSTRSITAEDKRKHAPQEGSKKRESKHERKRMIADIIDEVVVVTHETPPSDDHVASKTEGT
jgi:RNA recognition motif-containing protein